ncbi:MAG: C25 family cysteine peptidase [Bacteroidetes bacterium]|nr:C25 family cysteine peptidase [Bacteroidota bacterium]MCL1968144.1 C25 family cysteine peptidase [Bacteroidota bacterium]
MKKSITFSVILALFCTFSFAQRGYNVNFSQPNPSEYQISFEVTQWNLQNVQFDGVQYQQIIFSRSTVTNEKGWAELPFVTASVQLPAQKDVDLNVVYTEYQDIQLNDPLLPSRGTILRNQDPSTIPYQIDPNSLVNSFYPASIAIAEEPFIMRDVRGTTVTVYPFQWNAVTMTLRVYSKMTVMLVENNQPATNPLLTENPNPIREVRGMYKSIFINYQEPRIPLTMAEYGDILVITTARDEAAIQPYIDWKLEKGYNVEKEVVATGYSATQTKSLIQSKYSSNPNLMYVLLVGGWNDIKSESASFGSLGSGPTDPMLGDLAGNANDYRPEISIGRMSANNATEVTTQVNKAIQYEKNPNMDGWYSSFIGIGSNDAGPADDGERDWLHIQRIYSERLEPTYNYTTHYRLYANEGGCTAANLANYINTGASTIAYCGHGDWNQFVTTGFNNNNVNQLTNGNKLPFIVSVACLNGAFHSHGGSCFAEVWLKKQNGGAVVTWMSTINQPWAEPMRGQDYFYDILVGGFDYNQYPGQNGINTNELRTHWGSIAVNAANLMLSESSQADDKHTVRTWTTFGDPNLQLRTKQPVEIVSSMPVITPGSYETTITAGGDPVEGALVCISQDGVYYSAFTDENGIASIENELLPGEALLVVTAFNTTTIYETLPVNGNLELNAPLNLTSAVEIANHVILNWEAPKEGKGLTVKGYNVYRNDELITIEPVREGLTYTDIAPVNGEYKYEVTALYNTSGSLESEKSEPAMVVIDGMCVLVSNIDINEEIEDNTILITWNAPAYEGTELVGYNIYRNHEKLNAEIIPVEILSFLDENCALGTNYCYQLEVIYNDCEEVISEEICHTLSVPDIAGYQSFSIFPNPANGNVTIEGNGLNRVEMYNIQGQKLADYQSLTGKLQMNVNSYGNGIYFVRLYSDNSVVAVKRLVVIQ